MWMLVQKLNLVSFSKEAVGFEFEADWLAMLQQRGYEIESTILNIMDSWNSDMLTA